MNPCQIVCCKLSGTNFGQTAKTSPHPSLVADISLYQIWLNNIEILKITNFFYFLVFIDIAHCHTGNHFCPSIQSELLVRLPLVQ